MKILFKYTIAIIATMLMTIDALSAQAQNKISNFGIRAGINWSGLIGNGDSSLFYLTNPCGTLITPDGDTYQKIKEVGFTGGIFYEFNGEDSDAFTLLDYNPVISFQIGCNFAMKGSKVEYNKRTIKTKLHYIEIPFNLIYRRAIIDFGGGPYFGCGIIGKQEWGKNKYEVSCFEDGYNKNGVQNLNFKRFEFGLNFSFGLGFDFLHYELRCQYSLTDLYKDEDVAESTLRNVSIMLCVELRFSRE